MFLFQSPQSQPQTHKPETKISPLSQGSVASPISTIPIAGPSGLQRNLLKRRASTDAHGPQKRPCKTAHSEMSSKITQEISSIQHDYRSKDGHHSQRGHRSEPVHHSQHNYRSQNGHHSQPGHSGPENVQKALQQKIVFPTPPLSQKSIFSPEESYPRFVSIISSA